MRAGLSTIQQTLTTEAATVLTHSIAEAARRNHGQTTPLHVAATLLAAPRGILRQACIKSHPNSSHPLQCRALELCFSIALDRLPSNPNNSPSPENNNSNTNSSAVEEPPISNALMAALKRAQAQQRRGCPEHQQSPLLAVKVELEQLVVSILDDPSVSRIMKEASFSSPAVKATIEQSLSSSSSTTAAAAAAVGPPPLPSAAGVGVGVGVGVGLGSRPAAGMRNLYMNPRLQQKQQQNKKQESDVGEEVKKVIEILLRSKKRNPVLVGDSDLNSVMRVVLERVERRELGSPVRVISVEKEFGSVERTQIPEKIRELRVLIESRVRATGSDGVVLDLGDLKWLVEVNGGMGARMIQQPHTMISEIGKEAVAEMGRIIAGGGGLVWAMGTATCATYLRCQVYHPTMENEWDLEAVPIAPRAPLPGLFPRLGSSNGILSNSVEPLTPPKGFQAIKPAATIPLRWPPETITDASQKQTLCSQCTENYERELAKLVAKEFEKSSSDSRPEARPALPQWLQIATPSSTKPSPDLFKSKEHELSWKQSMEQLLKRWRQNCSRLHSNTFGLRSLQPKSSLALGFPSLQMAHSNSSERPVSPPTCPVKTDLVLGRPKPMIAPPSLENAHRVRIKDFPECKQDNFSSQRTNTTIASFEDSDSLKRLFKGLMEKVSWQTEAASTVTDVVLQSKSGNGKRRGLMPKAGTWLLFIGPDRVGKRKMASALSDLVFGVEPFTVRLGSPRTGGDDGESNVNFRGRTVLDRVAQAVKQNPFSVIMLEDIDQADTVIRGTIKQAIERGRLPDSHGREVSLGSSIFVLTANWLPQELKCSTDSLVAEEKILNSASSGWQLKLSVGGKRIPDWLSKDNNPPKRKKESNGLGLSLDLNVAAGDNADDETGEGSWNSSDLTMEHEHGRLAIKQSVSSASEFIDSVDNVVIFKPVDFGPLRRRISDYISAKFTAILGSERSIQIDDNVLDRIVGGVWLSGVGAEEWAEKVLVPSIEQFRNNSSSVDDGAAIRLSAMEGGGRPPRILPAGDWLPSTVRLPGI